MVEQLIPGVTRLGPGVEWRIVGVYRAVRNGGPRGDFPEIDVPFAQSPWPGTTVAVRTSVAPDTLRPSLAASVQALDPDLAITDMMTMDQRVHESLAGDRFMAVLFGGFAAAALVLAALGIYGVMSFAVAQRTHEIGLRMALGAGRDQVLRQILRDGITTSLVGVLFGSDRRLSRGARHERNAVRRRTPSIRRRFRSSPGCCSSRRFWPAWCRRCARRQWIR